MPKVPVYQSQARISGMPGVQQADQSAAGASPEAFGADVAQQTQSFGAELTKIGQDMQQRSDTLAAKDAFDQASTAMRETLYDPQKGVFTRKGGAARGASSSTAAELKKIRDGATKSLNGKQREMFSRFWDQSEESALVSVARHESEQMGVAERETNASIKKNAIAMSAAQYGDLDMVQKNIDIATATIQSEAAREAWGKDQFDQEVRTLKTQAVGSAAAAALANNNTQQAEAILKKYEGQLDENVVRDLRQNVAQKNDVIWAQTETDKLLLGKTPEQEAEVLDAARKLATGERRARLEQQVQARFADLRRFDQEALRAKTEQVTGMIFAAPSMSQARTMVDNIQDLRVRTAAEQAFRIQFGEQIALANQERAMARAEARQNAREGQARSKADEKALKFQQDYDKVLPFAQGDPVKLEQLIRAHTEGAREEELVHYALSRFRSEQAKPQTTRQTLIEQVTREVSNQRVLDAGRAWVDTEKRAGRPVTPERIGAYVTSPEFSTKDGQPLVDKGGYDKLVNYARGGGLSGEVPQTKVESILKNLDRTNAKWDLSKFPGLYDMVLERLTPGKEPTDADISQIIQRLLVAKGQTPAWGGLWNSSQTAYQALRDGTIKNFNFDIPAQEQQFFKSFLSILPGVKANAQMQQEFAEQVLAPDIFAGQPRAIPEIPGVSDQVVMGFYSWMKRTQPDAMMSDKIKDPKFVGQLFDIYKRGASNARK